MSVLERDEGVPSVGINTGKWNVILFIFNLFSWKMK